MARNSKQGRRPAPRPSASGSEPRRLGGANAAPSSSAQRRYSRSHRSRSSMIGWVSVVVVVAIIAVFIIVKATGSNSPATSNSSGVVSGQHPLLATATMLDPVTSVSPSVFNRIGVFNQPEPFVVTQKQPPLRSSDGKVRFVYMGAEYCPFCAAERWALVAALSRFGTFTALHQTTSSSSDTYPNIPTFSFLGSTYSSPYLSFTPYEFEDRNQNPLMSVPAAVNALYTKYDGASTGTPAPTFNPGSSAGIPFLDIDNKYVSAGDPTAIAGVAALLSGGGPGANAIANSVADPTSTTGLAIDSAYFISEANYLSAAICASNGAKPATVCNSSGVKAAAKNIAAKKPVG